MISISNNTKQEDLVLARHILKENIAKSKQDLPKQQHDIVLMNIKSMKKQIKEITKELSSQ